VPAVAIAAMGTEDILEGDAGGFLVPEDRDLFASHVLALLSDEALHRRKAAEAGARASRWTLESTTDSLLGVYARAIENRALSRAGARCAGARRARVSRRSRSRSAP
jgi:1,2-diacylglycerol 3-alpha-glucosyltransferase